MSTHLTPPHDFRRRVLIGAALGISALAIGFFCSWLRWPTPSIHDEFSYLLAADTFCEGRLTNPTHPMWRHFETMHVIHQPSYSSKYPPGQAAMLAIGQWLTGWPIAGVWLTSALAVMASYWMLSGMLAQKWAIAGGIMLLLHPGFQLHWGQSYWGGTLAFAGGSLVLGAAIRFAKRLRAIDSVCMAVGAILLAVTRPFEGLVFCLLIAAWVILRWLKQGPPPVGTLLTRVVLPQFVVLLLGAVVIASYNIAVTGQAMTMPYQLHEEQYSVCPVFLWQPLAEGKNFDHDSMAKLHDGWSIDWYNKQQSLKGFLRTKLEFLRVTLRMLLPLPLAIPLLLCFWWKGRRLRAPLLLLTFTWLGTQMAIWNYPHYLAPAAPVFLIALVYGLRNTNAATREWCLGIKPVLFLVAIQAMVFGFNVWTRSTAPTEAWCYARQAIMDELRDLPGQHLVVVKYSDEHSPHEEWVYNRADIDHAKVVWARPMAPENEQELIRYFSDHKLWLLEADDDKPKLAPYSRTSKYDDLAIGEQKN